MMKVCHGKLLVDSNICLYMYKYHIITRYTCIYKYHIYTYIYIYNWILQIGKSCTFLEGMGLNMHTFFPTWKSNDLGFG